MKSILRKLQARTGLDGLPRSEARSSSEMNIPAEHLVYEDLDSASGRLVIRLMNLLPAETLSKPVQCNLRAFNLDGCPKYEALSYCWGDVKDKTPIICNGARLDVPQSLPPALRHLRRQDEARFFWIDAICINEDDITERSQQVGIMSHIYRCAQRTVVWLGEQAEDSEVAINLCKQRVISRFPVVDDDASTASSSGPEQLTRPQTDAVARLLKRPWFNRLWVVQEAALATEVIMVCGDQEIDFDMLYIGLCALLNASRRMSTGRPNYMRGIFFLSMLREWRGKKSRLFDLLMLLVRTRTRCSTDLLDKVFALYGLTSTDLKALKLEPDYRLNAAELYTQVAFALLNSTRNLKLLETPRGATQLRTRLPSWAPDWSDNSIMETPISDRQALDLLSVGTERVRSLAAKTRALQGAGDAGEQLPHTPEAPILDTDDEGGQRQTIRPDFSASKHSCSPPPILGAENALSLIGQIVDQVCHTGQVAIVPTVDQEALSTSIDKAKSEEEQLKIIRSYHGGVCSYIRVLHEWEDLALEEKGDKYPTGETQLTAYWQTLCAGYFRHGYEKAEADFHVWRNVVMAPRVSNWVNNFDVDTTDVRAIMDTEIGEHSHDPKYREFGTASEPTLQRRLVRTINGYLGLVPSDARVGDSIAILKGGQLPFILRPRGASWELVGPSYIHGIMYGEAFDEERCVEIRLV